MLKEIRNIIIEIQPHYSRLNSKYSKSYLQGSNWYVGDDLLYWWDRCNNIRYFAENKNKLLYILCIIEKELKNKKELLK